MSGHPYPQNPYSGFRSGLFERPHHGAEPLQLLLLFLMVFSSAFVLIDVVYNILAMAAIGVFALFGLRLDRGNIPFILFLVVYNIGGLSAVQPYLDFKDATDFMIGTCFVGITAIFMAMTVNENALSRLEAFKWGMVMGGLMAATAGIVGYFNIAGLGPIFSMYEGRASGTFRDPNVLGSFLVLPSLLVVNDLLRNPSKPFIRLIILLPIMFGLFLTFSRGSWFGLIMGLFVVISLTRFTSTDKATNRRVLGIVIGLLIIVAIGLVAILSVEDVQKMVADRFVLQKDYDSGPSGRFGNQARSLPDLLTRPFGHGPNRFWLFYPENPHNTYLMAFSSYGWLGGITFLAFIATTVFISLRNCLTPSPFQGYAIVIFGGLVPHLVQNFQIDTDRWRHLFLIYGLSWGLAAITQRWLWERQAYGLAAYHAQMARGGQPSPAE